MVISTEVLQNPLCTENQNYSTYAISFSNIDRGDPYEIIKQAKISAIESKKRMARERRISINYHLVDSILMTDKKYSALHKLSQYHTSNGKCDFSFKAREEASISKQYFRIIIIRLRMEGYDIRKRIHNESEGMVDEFNLVLNIAGGILRFFFEVLYPLPSVSEYDYTQSGENISPTHKDLPSLDFADIIRTHIQELCYAIFKHNVPQLRIKWLVLDFLLECTPYFNWIYQGGRRGVNSKAKINNEKYYQKTHVKPSDLDRILRKHIRAIQTTYFQVGRNIREYKEEDDSWKEDVQEYIKRFVEFMDLWDYVEYINQEAIDEIYEKRSQMLRSAGTLFHQQILTGLPSIYNIDDVFFSGNKYTQYYPNLRDDVLILVETRLEKETKTRKADIIVLFHTRWEINMDGLKKQVYLWLPLIIFDIKTRMAIEGSIHELDISREKHLWTTDDDEIQLEKYFNKMKSEVEENQEHTRFIPSFRCKLKQLNKEQWKRFGYAELNEKEITQIKEYAEMVEESFFNTTGTKITLLTGIIRVAPTSNKMLWHDAQQEILSLIYNVVDHITTKSSTIQQVFYPKEESSNYLSAVLSPYNTSQIVSVNPEETKSRPRQSRKRYIEYYTVASSSSDGTSAAWIAGFHHILPYIDKIHKKKDICILDVSNTLHHFTKQRLRVDGGKLQDILEKTAIIPLNEMMKNPKQYKYDIYLITGFHFTSYDIDRILEILPQNAWIYVIREARSDEYLSAIYKKRTVKPSENNLRTMYNVATPPIKPAQKTPGYDGYRIILSLNRGWEKISAIPIPILNGYSSKFYSKPRKKEFTPYPYWNDDEIIQDALDLFPWYQPSRTDYTETDYEILNARAHKELIEETISDLSNQDIELKNISFVKPKSPIGLTHAIRRREEKWMDNLPRVKTRFPIALHLLKPPLYQVSKDDVERTIMKRINEILDIIEEEYPEEYELNVLYSKLRNQNRLYWLSRIIAEDKGIENQRILSILDYYKSKAYTTYLSNSSKTKHIVSSKSHLHQLDIPSHLMLLLLFSLNEEIDEGKMKKIWWDLFSYTLQALGFYPDKITPSFYDPKFVLKHLFGKGLGDEFQTSSSVKMGTVFVVEGYMWIQFQNTQPMLFTTPYGFGHYPDLYYRVIDPKIIASIDELSEDNLEIYIPIQVYRISGVLHITKWNAETKSWEIVGKYHEFLQNGSISAIKISPSLYSLPDEINTQEPMVMPIKHNINRLTVHYVYGKFQLDPKTEIIILDLYELGFDEDELLIGDYLDEIYVEDAHEMITRLRWYKSEYHRIGRRSYYLDVVKHIDWKGWVDIRSMVQGYRKVTEGSIPKNFRQFSAKYREYLELNDLKEVELEISIHHNDDNSEENPDKCPVLLLGQDRAVRYAEEQRKGIKLYDDLQHEDCFYVMVGDYSAFKLSKETIGRLREIKGLKDGKDIYDDLISSIIIDDEYVIRLELKPCAECREDYWLRRLFRESGQGLKWLPVGGTFVDEEYMLESIIYDGYSIQFVYFYPGSGKRDRSKPVYHSNECKAIYLWEREYENQSSNYSGIGDFDEYSDIIVLKEKIQAHLESCSNDLHDETFSDEMYYDPVSIVFEDVHNLEQTVSIRFYVVDFNGTHKWQDREFDGLTEAITGLTGILENIHNQGTHNTIVHLQSYFGSAFTIRNTVENQEMSLDLLMNLIFEIEGNANTLLEKLSGDTRKELKRILTDLDTVTSSVTS